ncbi:hypothetical protein SD51_12850 [Alicyclobacillus tengchongensis]|nr:hypothetical protein SD51_12850 [Alicyclobacillus tengchongensis]
MLALILSLGMDTLMLSISLGMVKTKRKLKVALTFACAEALMPLIGLFIGKGAGQFIGQSASLIGGVALLAVAVWLIFFEDEDEAEKELERNLVGWTLVVTALSISVDELAVGFSIGLVGVPITLTIALIALQAFIFTFIHIKTRKKHWSKWGLSGRIDSEHTFVSRW